MLPGSFHSFAAVWVKAGDQIRNLIHEDHVLYSTELTPSFKLIILNMDDRDYNHNTWYRVFAFHVVDMASISVIPCESPSCVRSNS